MGQKTTWHAKTNFEKPREWLLGDGNTITEPALEQTASGRKVRIAGTTRPTTFASDQDQLILDTIRAEAEEKGTFVWMPLDKFRSFLEENAGIYPATSSTALYLNEEEKATRVWWRFRHPTLPIEAMVVVHAAYTNPHWRKHTNHTVGAHLIMPRTTPVDTLANWYAMQPEFYVLTDDTLPVLLQNLEYKAEVTTRQFIKDTRPEWTAILGQEQHRAAHKAARLLLRNLRTFDDLAEIEILDQRDVNNPTWLTLELADTNYDPNLAAELADFLDGETAVEEAARIYADLLTSLRKLGIVFSDAATDHFQQALLAGSKGVTVEIDTPPVDLDNPDEDDGYHELTLHLPTGTFAVSCGVPHRDRVAERWDEARTIASLSGEEDTLLAFAREVTSRDQQKKVRKVLRQRQKELDE